MGTVFNRRNQVLTGILVVQVVLAVVVFWPNSQAARAVSEPLFPDTRAGNLASLTIRDNEDEEIQLAKQSGEWVLPASGGYPAEEEKVDELVEKIAALQAKTVVTQSGSSHARLKVADDDYERRIDMSLSDGTEHRLYVGSTVSSRASHVRDGEHDEVYLAEDLSSWQASTSVTSWVDAVYFKVEEDSVARMVVRNGQGRFEFSRTEEGNWSMENVPRGREFDADKATRLLRRITSLRLRTPLGKEDQAAFGLGDPSAVVEVTVRETEEAPLTVDGEAAEPPAPKEVTRTLSIGAEGSEDDTYVVKSTESAYFVEVSSWSVEDFVTEGRDYFLKSDDES